MEPLNSLAARDVRCGDPPVHRPRPSCGGRPAGAGPGRRRVRARRARPALSRGHGGSVVRQSRLQRGAPGRGGAGADEPPAYLPPVRRQVARPGDRARGAAAGDGARADVEGPVHLLGLGGQRHRDQAGALLPPCARQAGQAQDHRARARLPWRDARLRQSHRPASRASRLRPAARGLSAYRMPAPLSLRSAGGVRGGVRDPLGGGAGAA